MLCKRELAVAQAKVSEMRGHAGLQSSQTEERQTLNQQHITKLERAKMMAEQKLNQEEQNSLMLRRTLVAQLDSLKEEVRSRDMVISELNASKAQIQRLLDNEREWVAELTDQLKEIHTTQMRTTETHEEEIRAFQSQLLAEEASSKRVQDELWAQIKELETNIANTKQHQVIASEGSVSVRRYFKKLTQSLLV